MNLHEIPAPPAYERWTLTSERMIPGFTSIEAPCAPWCRRTANAPIENWMGPWDHWQCFATHFENDDLDLYSCECECSRTPQTAHYAFGHGRPDNDDPDADWRYICEPCDNDDHLPQPPRPPTQRLRANFTPVPTRIDIANLTTTATTINPGIVTIDREGLHITRTPDPFNPNQG